jgi:hypothetical protein
MAQNHNNLKEIIRVDALNSKSYFLLGFISSKSGAPRIWVRKFRPHSTKPTGDWKCPPGGTGEPGLSQKELVSILLRAGHKPESKIVLKVLNHFFPLPRKEPSKN